MWRPRAVPGCRARCSAFLPPMSDSLSALPAQPSSEDWAAFLRQTQANFDCVTGTLHRLDPADNLLKLVTCERIPEVLMPVIPTIPIGKGVAGAAAQRKEPVELCNLQTDT